MKRFSRDEWLEIIKSAYCEGIPCHGCSGKGWVAPSYGVVVVCPICNGTAVAQSKYIVKRVAYSAKLNDGTS